MSKKKKKSSYGVAFFIRLAVLLVLGGILGGGLIYDRAVVIPQADAKIREIVKTKTVSDEDSREKVIEIAGKQPFSTEQIGVSTVHEYRFGRLLSFLAPRVCTVVFNQDGTIVESYTGPISDADRDFLAEQRGSSSR